MPLSEDEQRVLDELERQLRGAESRAGESRTRRVADRQPERPTVSVPPALLGVAVIGGFLAVVLGVLLGGVFGIALSWVGFIGMVFGGAGLARLSQARIAEQLQVVASRYGAGPQRRPPR